MGFIFSTCRYCIDEPVTYPANLTLVLLHGATPNTRSWDAVRRHLNPKYRLQPLWYAR